jgi:hypothetical protein
MTAVDPELIERVKAAKAHRQASPLQYRDRSRIAFVCFPLIVQPTLTSFSLGLGV